MTSRNGKARRWLVAAVILAASVALPTPTADAFCKRCSVGLCIDAAASGGASCQEVILVFGFPPTTFCELSGNCTYGDGDGGPCQPNGCEPEQPI